jgi:predicted enzyme related to lactoylglutathione lyase
LRSCALRHERCDLRALRDNVHIMQLKFTSLLVSDQDKALDFYTRVLGFSKCADIPMGPMRWLTLNAPEGLAGLELVLEPTAFAPAAAYQRALFEAGKPALALTTTDITAVAAKLKQHGVKFRSEPTHYGMITAALFEDTVGNVINLVQPSAPPAGA